MLRSSSPTTTGTSYSAATPTAPTPGSHGRHTAEIAWSADTPAVVRNAVFAPHGGTSFQRDGFAADFRRGLLYLEGHGLHRIPTSTMTRTCTSA